MTVSTETLRSISTPERVDSRLGTLDFVDGFPSPQTVETLYDQLDFVHALNVFLNGSYPTPAATADDDGSTTVVFRPEQPPDIPEGNWIQTTEAKGLFVLLHLYSPLQPYFDKTWRPSEIEPLA